nr:hypothetical protein SPSIL_55240 [Sporomusa silvacetica DSM 10669]
MAISPRRRSSYCITSVKAMPAPLCCAPAGDTVCRVNVLYIIRKLCARALVEGDGGGEPLTITGGAGYVGQLGSVVAGGDRTVGMLLERVGPG